MIHEFLKRLEEIARATDLDDFFKALNLEAFCRDVIAELRQVEDEKEQIKKEVREKAHELSEILNACIGISR